MYKEIARLQLLSQVQDISCSTGQSSEEK